MNASFLTPPEWLMGDWVRACADPGTLHAQRCTSCGFWRHPPRRFCAACSSPSWTFEAVAGTGTVRSFAVSHRSLDPAWHAHAPFVTLVVELDEGPRMLAATRHRAGDTAIGDRVQLSLERRSDVDIPLVWAERVRSGPAAAT